MESQNDNSDRWRERVFAGPSVRAVASSGSTTIAPLRQAWTGTIVHCEGHHELAAAQFLEYLWHVGMVRRYKLQPFDLRDIGGPKGFPDILVELWDGAVCVIQVKSHRFLTVEIQEKFAIERDAVEGRGMRYLCWTDRLPLRRHLRNNVLSLERGYRFPISWQLCRAIEEFAVDYDVLGPVLDKYGWDATLSAASLLAFHIDVTLPLNHETSIFKDCPIAQYTNFFTKRHVIGNDWWGALRSHAP